MIIGESVAKQHRLVVSKLTMWTKWRKEVKPREEDKVVEAEIKSLLQ